MIKPVRQIQRPLLAAALLSALSAISAQAGTRTVSSGKTPVGPVGPVTTTLSPWDVTAAAGLGMSRGNNDTLNLSAQFLATYLKDSNEGLFGVDYAYAETGSDTTVNNLHIFGAYNRTLGSGPLYAGILADGWHDEIADLNYRISLMPTLGVYLIKNDRTVLALEGSAGYVWEDQGDVSRDYWGYRLGQRFTHRTESGIKFNESVSWSPEFQDSENWQLVAQAGFAVPVSTHWAVGASARYTYDNQPAADREKDDLAVLATLNYSLKGFAPEAEPTRRSLKVEKKAAALPDMGWTNSAGLAFALSSGNSDTLSLIGDLVVEHRSEKDEWLNHAAIAYGETESTTTLQNVLAASQYNYLFTDHVFAGLGSGFRYDDIAAIDYQVTPAATLGTYLIKNNTAKLSLEAGPGYVFEKVGGEKNDYFAVQAAQKLTCALSEGVLFTEAVVYNAEASDFNNYTLTATAALDVAMTSSMSFRTAVSNIYDNTPAAGLEKNDLLLSAGIAVRF